MPDHYNTKVPADVVFSEVRHSAVVVLAQYLPVVRMCVQEVLGFSMVEKLTIPQDCGPPEQKTKLADFPFPGDLEAPLFVPYKLQLLLFTTC